MASGSQNIAGPQAPNWLDRNGIPAELKLKILEYTSSHSDLMSLLKAYPIWVNAIWSQYPKQLFRGALYNVFKDIGRVRVDVLYVYYIRKIRKDYTIAMGSSEETQLHRNRLQSELREMLSSSSSRFPDLEESLQTVLDIADIIRDVNSLTYRYSNDAWKRIHDIAEQIGTKPDDFPMRDDPPAINLTSMERRRFNRAFLRVEIYLLTRYWTNAQDQRHILDMGQDIEPYLPHPDRNPGQRQAFDSCLRYIFHAYRGYLKDAAREIGAPELPSRDELQWVPDWFEEKDYQYRDYQTIKHVPPKIDFSQRSVSDEQRFLLWLCEFGIGPLQQTHKADDRARRDELIVQFSRRHIWETVELRHRVSRYDIQPAQSYNPYKLRSHPDRHRNRHPVMSLYGHASHLQYYSLTPPWACASAFLKWAVTSLSGRQKYHREGVTLDNYGRWITLCDTDRGACDWNPFQTKGLLGCHVVPHGHPYMFDLENYEMRPMKDSVPRFLLRP